MRQITGILIFSFLFLFPLKADSKVKIQDCSADTTWCELAANGRPGCVPNSTYSTDCRVAMQALEKKKGTVYSLEEGTMIKCEGNSKLVPLYPQDLKNSYWTCRSPENAPPSEKN